LLAFQLPSQLEVVLKEQWAILLFV